MSSHKSPSTAWFEQVFIWFLELWRWKYRDFEQIILNMNRFRAKDSRFYSPESDTSANGRRCQDSEGEIDPSIHWGLPCSNSEFSLSKLWSAIPRDSLRSKKKDRISYKSSGTIVIFLVFSAERNPYIALSVPKDWQNIEDLSRIQSFLEPKVKLYIEPFNAVVRTVSEAERSLSEWVGASFGQK